MITQLLSTLLTLFILPSQTKPTPLMMLKTGHSGSSWFTSLLNRYEGVYVTEEIIWGLRKEMKERENVEKLTGGMTAYIFKSLQHPMLKWPNGEDMNQRNKTFFIVGCTFNPWKSFANLDKIARLVPSLRVIAYFRSNVVKHVISYFRGQQLWRKCRNFVTWDECKLESKTTVELKEFDKRLIEAMAEDLNIWKVAHSLTANLTHSLRVVFYEDLIGDRDELEELLWWLGFDITELEFTDRTIGRCKSNCTKNTSDDLRDVIANYEEAESFINSKYPCLSSQFYEKRPGKVQPFIQNVCGNLFTSRVNSLLKHWHKN